jgi:signal transduction histidine kinase/ActR/RegA family two-component response regulator
MQYNTVKNIDNLIGGNEKLLQELQVSNELREIERDLLSTESKIRGAIATNDTSYLKEIDNRIAETNGYLDSLKLVSDQDSTLKHIIRLHEIADEKMAFKNRVLDSFNYSGRIPTASFKYFLQPRMHINDETNDLSYKLTESRRRLLDSLSISVSRSGKKARTLGTIMIVAVLISEACLFWYIITRIKRQNQLIKELDASEKKLREVSMIKENFMANMSHEIRTPMNSVLGFTHLLESKNQDPELAEFVNSIRIAGENLLTIINDILDISKIEAGMIRIETVPFSIGGILHSIQILFAEKIKEKGLGLTCSIDEDIPEMLSGDATRLTQILVNMIGNAVKFTPKGTIHIAVENKGITGNLTRVGFIIRDTGIGIAREKLSDIFERFKQAEDSITRNYGGTGLGLSIAKDLILIQNGEIEVESEEGIGTTFRFSIPYEIASANLQSLKLPQTTEWGYSEWKYTHILVVDDNEMNQNLLKHLLKKWNFTFEMANNGFEALEKLKISKYDLILMDVQMPLMDGYTATREIRTKLKSDIPIVAMTAHAFPGEREKCLNYGMNEYIAKPINEQELSRILSEFPGIKSGAANILENPKKVEANGYQYINLECMQEISGGDKQYERTITTLFLETIPLDLEMLDSALVKKDLIRLRQTAHEMKTNVSVMGLSEKLQFYLDELEYAPFDDIHFRQTILAIKTICLNALPEARHFYSTLSQ